MTENESMLARIDERTKDIIISLTDMKNRIDKMENCIHRVNDDKPSWGNFRWIIGIIVATVIGAYGYTATIQCNVNNLSDKVIVLEQKHVSNFADGTLIKK